MNLSPLRAIVVTTCVLALCGDASAQRELRVHLAQANNDSPYAFVRAKFEPGELSDPWAVRFFDDKGSEIPYFVWDAVTWGVARKGRADWGESCALLNHAAGALPEVTEARSDKLRWAKKQLPELGAKLEEQDRAAKKAPDSICAVMYVLRHRVPPFAKERLTLKIYPIKQAEPKGRTWKDGKGESMAVQQGGLELQGLPDQLAVVWKGKEICRSAGIQAGGWTDTVSHADRSRPFTIDVSEGIITKVAITAQTKGR